MPLSSLPPFPRNGLDCARRLSLLARFSADRIFDFKPRHGLHPPLPKNSLLFSFIPFFIAFSSAIRLVRDLFADVVYQLTWRSFSNSWRKGNQ